MMIIKFLSGLFSFLLLLGIQDLKAQDLIVTYIEEFNVRILEVNDSETMYILSGDDVIRSLPNGKIKKVEWNSKTLYAGNEFVVPRAEYVLIQEMEDEMYTSGKRAKKHMALSALFVLGGFAQVVGSEDLNILFGGAMIGAGGVLGISAINSRVRMDRIKKDLRVFSIEQFTYSTKRQLKNRSNQISYCSLANSGLGLQLNF